MLLVIMVVMILVVNMEEKRSDELISSYDKGYADGYNSGYEDGYVAGMKHRCEDGGMLVPTNCD